MATSYTRTAVVDIDGLSTTDAATAINAAIEVLEAAGFVVTSIDYETMNRGGGLPVQLCVLTGLLAAYAGDANAIGLVKALTLTVNEADLTAAAAAETLDFAEAIPEGSYIVGVRIGLTTPFTGGAASDFTVDVGFPANVDALVDGADVFAAAVGGEASTRPLGIAPNMLVTGDATARTPSATFRCGTDDVADVTAGDCDVTILYAAAA